MFNTILNEMLLVIAMLVPYLVVGMVLSAAAIVVERKRRSIQRRRVARIRRATARKEGVRHAA